MGFCATGAADVATEGGLVTDTDGEMLPQLEMAMHYVAEKLLLLLMQPAVVALTRGPVSVWCSASRHLCDVRSASN